MWFCLILIGCYIGLCALQGPFVGQVAACSDDDDDDLGDFLDEAARIDHTGLNALPGDPQAWWCEDEQPT